MDSYGPDMNDPKVIKLYSELLVFANKHSESELLYDEPDHLTRKALQIFSSQLDLEYEYSLAIGVVRITHITREPLGLGANSMSFKETFPELGASLENEPFMNIPASFPSLSDAELFEEFINFPPSPLPVATSPILSDGGVEQVQGEVHAIDQGSGAYSPIGQASDNDFLHGRPTDILSEEPLFNQPNPAPNTNDEIMDFIESRKSKLFPQSSPRSIPLAMPFYAKRSKPATSFPGNYVGYNSSPDSRNLMGSSADSPFIFSRRMSREHRPHSLSSRSSISAGSTASSKRRGPLSTVARASMKAVKAVGACWRCKMLRKHCDPATPCAMCPKRRTVLWGTIGCKRGELKMHTMQLNICPTLAYKNGELGFDNEPALGPPGQHSSDAAICNIRWQRALKRRNRETIKLDPLCTLHGTDLGGFIQRLEARKPILKGIGDTRDAISLPRLFGEKEKKPLSSSNTFTAQDDLDESIQDPLDNCIVAIIWELINCPHSDYLQDEEFEAEVAKLCALLRYAAIYQAKYRTNQLVSKSLDCLRASLECLNLKLSGKLSLSAHPGCDTSHCAFAPLSNLNALLDSYLDELSQVLFKKENLRSKDWWLSVFYSLCIQAIVRSTLQGLVEGRVQDFPSHQPQGLKEYLHVAVRLFIASSRDYDPMVETISGTDKGVSEAADFLAARLALTWDDDEHRSSANYLKHLFEDDGEPLVADS
ncbi:C6 finger domain-containing protein [Phlyctema vagabunda]|uniref:C6 finger domain-containing protein n=1 Tax=Phlyctema vagabunda TaxID=108571 RepID=A0ABR4PG47_9HELO